MNKPPLHPSDFDQPTPVIRLTGSGVESILDKPFELYERARAAWRGSTNGRIAHRAKFNGRSVANLFRTGAMPLS